MRKLFLVAAAATAVLFLLLAFVVALTIAIKAKADRQTKDLAGCPGRQADDDADNDPDMPPTDEFHLLAGKKRIVMHAGAVKVKAAFAAQRVVQGQHDHSLGNEGIDQQGSDGHGKGVERPSVMAEEAMKTRPVTVVDVVAGVDDLRDIAMADGQHPAGHQGTKQHEAGLGEITVAAQEQSMKTPCKITHGRPSLAWEFGK